MATQTVCTWNKYGYCRYGDVCRKLHVNEICDKVACEHLNCKLRHPTICKFYSKYNRCKFDPCAFKHEESEIENIKKENKKLMEKIDVIEKDLKLLNEKEIESKLFIDKITLLENTFEKFIAEKEEIINTLVQKVQILEDKCPSIEHENTTIFKENANSNEEPSVEMREDETFRCADCDFESSSNKGLNIHKTRKHGENNLNETVKKNCSNCDFETNKDEDLKLHSIRKHTNFENLTYPQSCEICEQKLENCIDFRNHMDIHSLTRTCFGDFRCNDCSFLSDNLESMVVHFGKCMVEILYCGLCDWKSDSIENLETHLAVCEVYECEECGKRVNVLKDIKIHIEQEHNKCSNIFHLKINRVYKKKVDCKKYSYTDI